MDGQIFQLIIWIGGILLTIIGFLIGLSIRGLRGLYNDLKIKVDNHDTKFLSQEEKISKNEKSISENKKSIQSNSEKDEIIRGFMEDKVKDLKGDIISLEGKIENLGGALRENNNLLADIVKELKKN